MDNQSMKKDNKKILLKMAIILLLIMLMIFVVALVYLKMTNNQATKNESKANLNNTTSEIENEEIQDTNIIEDEEDTTISSDTIENDDLIVLYRGYAFTMENHDDLYDISFTEANKEKYEITYYNYEDGEYVGEIKGELEEVYIDSACVINVSEFAISKNYNAIPRSYTEVEELPEELMELADYNNIEIEQIDLDGDGTLEYIVCVQYERNAEDTDDGKYTNYSEIMLFDNDFNKIARLAYAQDQYWEEPYTGEVSSKCLLSTDDVRYFDIDEDGIMEIIINLHVYEGIKIGVYKYDNGNLIGDIDSEVDIHP